MASRFPRIHMRLELALGALAVAGLSILSGYPKGAGETCGDFLAKARRASDSGDNTKALHWSTVGEPRCRADDVAQSWRLRLMRAEAQQALGSYSAALKTLEPAIPDAPSLIGLRARRAIDQAWNHFFRTEYDAAAALLHQAEFEARRAEPVSRAILSDIAFGKLYLYGQLGNAEAVRQAREQIISADSYAPQDLSAASGWALSNTANFEEAARYFESAIVESSPAANPLTVGQYYNNLAGIYYNLGDLDQSLRAALKAEPALRQGSDASGLRVCLNTAGLIHLDRGDYVKGEESLLQALHIANQLGDSAAKAEVFNNLTLAAIAAKDWAKAESFNRRAMDLESGHHLIESEQYSLMSKARILAGRSDFNGARATLDAVTAQQFINPNLRIDAEGQYISIFRKLGDEPNAQTHHRAALALASAVRSKMLKQESKLAWYSSQIALHQEWVRFLIENHRPEKALQWAEWSRARLMLERLESASSTAGREQTASAYRRLAREQHAVLLSYWLMPDTSYAWVVKPGGIQLIELPGEQTIASLVARYQAFVQDGNDPLHSSSPAAEELEQAILGPVLPAVGGAREVILVPDGQLHGLNFETLPVNGHYWIDDVTISVAPSLNILLANSRVDGAPPSPGPKPRGEASRRMLVVGDPEPTPEFRKLPQAAAEMANVARLFPAGTLLRGPGATRAAYLKSADSHAYIHFAAHASAIAERPLDSAVILSPDAAGSNDGRLTARDLLNQRSHAELVTISACRSAGVRSYRGEGLVGFAWVFLQSGAHGVVAGLWDASDKATSNLMAGFYERLAARERPPDALRQAKLAMLHSGSHFARPYYWGSFQYYQGAGHSRKGAPVV